MMLRLFSSRSFTTKSKAIASVSSTSDAYAFATATALSMRYNSSLSSSSSFDSPSGTSTPPHASTSSANIAVKKVSAVDFLRERASRAAAEQKISNEALGNFAAALEDMPSSVRSAFEQELSSHGGAEGFDRLTRHQHMQFAKRISSASASALAHELQHIQESSDTQQAIVRGQSTGDNYWIEAAGFFSDAEVPSFLKDEVFEEMRQDREVDPRFGVPRAEYISEEDMRECERMKKELTESTAKKNEGEADVGKQRTDLNDNIPRFE